MTYWPTPSGAERTFVVTLIWCVFRLIFMMMSHNVIVMGVYVTFGNAAELINGMLKYLVWLFLEIGLSEHYNLK